MAVSTVVFAGAVRQRTGPDQESDPTLRSLLALTRLRTQSARLSRHAALVLGYLLPHNTPMATPIECSLRRLAIALHLTPSNIRTALAGLVRWGWAERSRQNSRLGHYRLTPAFIGLIRESDPALCKQVHVSGDTYDPAQMQASDLDLRHALETLTELQLMHRLFELNTAQRVREGRGYEKALIRNVAALLHWLLKATARDPERTVVSSLRYLTAQTGLVYETAKRARQQLCAWGLLIQSGQVYRLNHERVIGLLYGEEAALPPAPRRNRRRALLGTRASPEGNADDA